MSGLISIQTVRHTNGSPERIFRNFEWRKKLADAKKHEKLPRGWGWGMLCSITIFNVKSDNMFSEIIFNFLVFQNDIADLVTDGLRVQRCHVKELKNKRKVSL